MNDVDRKFIDRVFNKQYYKIYKLHERYILNLVFSILYTSNIISYLKSDPITCERLIEHFNFSFQAKHALIWIFDFLEEMDYLKKKEQKETINYRVIRNIPHGNYRQLAKRILELDKGWHPSIRLMENIASEYNFFLGGNKSGLELLLSKEKIKLWNDYFNNTFTGYEVFNIFGAYGVSKWFQETQGVRLLELGGGSGGSAIKVLEAFKEKDLLNKVEEYIFSDISPIFLRMGNRLLMEKCPSFDRLTLKKIDFNKPMSEQKIEVESIDIVYAVNALHVSYDLSLTLREVYKILKKDGILVISELIRPTEKNVLCQEFIFNLLESYCNVKLDSDLRPNHGFLTVKHWCKNFEAAGFKNIELIVNRESFEPDVSLNSNEPIFALIMKGQKK